MNCQYEREVWAEIPGWEDYLVSTYGDIYSMRSKKLLQPYWNEGYLRVRLSRNGESQEHYVHHLVGKAYFAEYRSAMHIIHKDGDPNNNFIENLIPGRPGTYNFPIQTGRYSGGRPVRIVETGETFTNAYECALYLRADPSSVYKALRGERARCQGYTFEYL